MKDYLICRGVLFLKNFIYVGISRKHVQQFKFRVDKCVRVYSIKREKKGCFVVNEIMRK